MKRIQFGHSYDEIISVENLLEAWKEFKRDKAKKEDVQRFGTRLMEHILSLHTDLRNKTYRHGPYRHFRIADPKPRDIHKASVRDRLLHRALYRKLYKYSSKPLHLVWTFSGGCIFLTIGFCGERRNGECWPK